MDVVINVGWGQVRNPDDYPGGWTASEGCLELWLNDDGAGYEKQCLVPATNKYRSYRALGSKQQNIAPFTASADQKVLYGPNLENVNPPYMSLLSMRGDAGGVQPMDFESHIFFDELRVGSSLDDVRIPGSTVLDENLLDCSTFVVPEANKSLVVSDEQGFYVYPNPASDVVVAEVPLNPQEAGILRIVDALGKECYREVLPQLPIPDYRTQIPVRQLPGGLYTVQVTYSETQWSQKVVVRR